MVWPGLMCHIVSLPKKNHEVVISNMRLVTRQNCTIHSGSIVYDAANGKPRATVSPTHLMQPSSIRVER